jgi:zinc transport system substrate-binding protein
MPYERAWLPRLRAASPDMRVVNARATLDGRPTAGPDADGGHEHGHRHAHDEDPHVWTSPAAVRAMIGPLADALAAADPDHAADYRANATALGAELAALDTEVRTALAPLRSRRFVVFHPAWGQFAADYGLEQIAVEQDGKEPTARALAARDLVRALTEAQAP